MGQMHRLILDAPHHLDVDHVNGNGLDNRRCNIRLCTRAQNQVNAQKRRGCSSQYKGVDYRKDRNKWRASITINQQFKSLGHFNDETEAARAYNDAAVKYWGEFVRLNEVGDV